VNQKLLKLQLESGESEIAEIAAIGCSNAIELATSKVKAKR